MSHEPSDVEVAAAHETEGIDAQPRLLLLCGAAAGPFYVLAAGLQIILRDGFDLRRHAVSLLSNGSLGWVQVTNFVLTGLLVCLAAVGMRRALSDGIARRWGPILVGVYGLGLIASGAFTADPADGFPRGTPAGAPTSVSLQGTLHLIVGGVAFLALVGACLVFARRFAATGRLPLARFSRWTGAGFLAVWIVLIATGGTAALANLAFAVSVVVAWAWLSATCLAIAAART